MLRNSRKIEGQFHQIIDLGIMVVCLYLAHTIRRLLGEEFDLRRTVMFREQLLLACAVIIIGHYALKAHGFYRRTIGRTAVRVFWDAVRAMGVCILIVFAGLRVLEVRYVNIGTVFLFGALSAVALWIFDMAWQSLTVLSGSMRRYQRAAVLVGSESENQGLVTLIQRHPEWGIDVTGQLNLQVQGAEDLEKTL